MSRRPGEALLLPQVLGVAASKNVEGADTDHQQSLGREQAREFDQRLALLPGGMLPSRSMEKTASKEPYGNGIAHGSARTAGRRRTLLPTRARAEKRASHSAIAAGARSIRCPSRPRRRGRWNGPPPMDRAGGRGPPACPGTTTTSRSALPSAAASAGLMPSIASRIAGTARRRAASLLEEQFHQVLTAREGDDEGTGGSR